MLVNFWATTCVSCVKEMPDLVATYNKYQARGYETVAVAMSYDPPAWVLNFAQSRQLPFKVALDVDGSAAKAYGKKFTAVPVFIVRAFHHGAILVNKAGKRFVNQLVIALGGHAQEIHVAVTAHHDDILDQYREVPIDFFGLRYIGN